MRKSGKSKGNSRPLCGAMYYGDGVVDNDKLERVTVEVGDLDVDVDIPKVRINVYVTQDSYNFLKHEAARCATTAAALCSIAIQDMVDERRKKRQ